MFGSLRYGGALILIKLCFVLGLTIVCRSNFFFLVNGTWLREDQTPVILIGRELELVVLMWNPFNPET